METCLERKTSQSWIYRVPRIQNSSSCIKRGEGVGGAEAGNLLFPYGQVSKPGICCSLMGRFYCILLVESLSWKIEIYLVNKFIAFVFRSRVFIIVFTKKKKNWHYLQWHKCVYNHLAVFLHDLFNITLPSVAEPFLWRVCLAFSTDIQNYTFLL